MVTVAHYRTQNTLNIYDSTSTSENEKEKIGKKTETKQHIKSGLRL
jgi:hypothetical protein